MRGNRYIVTDGGKSLEWIKENTGDDAQGELVSNLCDRHGVRGHQADEGAVHFYKDGTDETLITSMVFDVGSFVSALCLAAETLNDNY